MKLRDFHIMAVSAMFVMLGAHPAWSQENHPRVTLELPGGLAPEAPEGPYRADWESLQTLYHTPEWFKDAKFGIFIHWGVYSVPAYGSEWYPKHMYNGLREYHIETWGDPEKFGYKDFIPLFKAEKFNPDEWADLFVEAGARYVIPTAEHHDGFAMYDSDLTEWDAKEKGPCRDIIGELSKAVRVRGLKFGVSDHRIENWDFMYPQKGGSSDLFDPQYAGLYGPPQKPSPVGSAMGPGTDENGNPAHPQNDAFLEEWLARAEEIVDKYQPDLFYFDNGVNSRSLDSWKLRFAQYYYNSALLWKKDVSIQTKSDAYLYGTIKDYERQSRAPKEVEEVYWQVDDPIGSKFGYVEGMSITSAGAVIGRLINNISRNGNLCLNISPKSDGTIPEDQQAVLREVGSWLKINGEGVYGTRYWKRSNDANDFFYTCKGEKYVYVFAMRWKGGELLIPSFDPESSGRVRSVSLLGGGKLKFHQSGQGLSIAAPETRESAYPAVFKLKIKP